MLLVIDNYDSFVFNVARYCAELGRPGDRQCEEQLLKDAATYSIAKEGHEGVIISVGAPVSVAVDPNARRTASE